MAVKGQHENIIKLSGTTVISCGIILDIKDAAVLGSVVFQAWIAGSKAVGPVGQRDPAACMFTGTADNLGVDLGWDDVWGKACLYNYST
jgi:hypothetical protein